MLLKSSATSMSIRTLEAGDCHLLLETLIEMLKVLINVLRVYCRITVALARLIIHRIIILWHEFTCYMPHLKNGVLVLTIPYLLVFQ